MSDLFDEFVFDLQRFDTAKYSEFGMSTATPKPRYWWKGGQSIHITTVDSEIDFAKDAWLTFSLSAGSMSYVEEVTNLKPVAGTYGLSFSDTEEGVSVLRFHSEKGNLNFGMSGVKPSSVVFMDKGDALTLNDFAIHSFGLSSAIYSKTNRVSDFLPGFDISNIPGNDNKKLEVTSTTSDFKLSGLSAGDFFLFLGRKEEENVAPEVDIEFAGPTTALDNEDLAYFGSASAGGSVNFNLKKALNISVESGGAVLVAQGAMSTGIQEIINSGKKGAGVSVNGMDFNKLETTGFIFDNAVGANKDQIVYFTDVDFYDGETNDTLEGQILNLSIGDNNVSVKGLSQNYSGLILDDNKKAAGFIFASSDSAATLLLGGGSISKDFKVYDGYKGTSEDTALKIPTVEKSGIAAIAKIYDKDEEKSYFALVVDNGAVVTDADKTTSVTVTAEDGDFVAVQFDEKGNIKGFMPVANPSLSGIQSDPKDFSKGLSIQVKGESSIYGENGLHGLFFGGASTYGSASSYVAIGSGKFTYSIDSDSKAVIALDSDADTVFALDNATKLKVFGGSGTVVDATDGNDDDSDDPTYTYYSKGKAYFALEPEAKEASIVIATDPDTGEDTTLEGKVSAIKGYVFMDAGDALTIDSLGSASLAIMYENASNSATKVSIVPDVDADSYTVEMTAAYDESKDVANFAVNNFSASNTAVQFGAASFVFGTTKDEFYFDSKGGALGFSAADSVFMDADAAVFLDGSQSGTFRINGKEVDIVAKVGEDGLIYDAKDNGEQSLFGLSSGSKIKDAGGITKIYGASGTITEGNNFVIGGVSYFYTAQGTSAAGRAFFNVSGSTAEGFTFVKEDDALKVTSAMPDAFTLTDNSFGKSITAPTAYVDEGSSTEVEAYTITKGQSSLYEISGLSDGNYVEMQTAAGSSASITLKDVSASAAVVYDMYTQALAGFANLEDGNQIKVAGVSTEVDFNINKDADDIVEIAGKNVSYTYTYGNSAALTEVFANVSINKLGGASYVQTAAGESGIGSYEFAVSGQSFGVASFSYAGQYKDEDVDGVKFVIGTASNVTAINDLEDTEYVAGYFADFAGVKINGQSFAVEGGSGLFISLQGDANAQGANSIYLQEMKGSEPVFVKATAGASTVLAADIEEIAFGTASAFTIAGKGSESGLTTGIKFNLNGLSVVGISDVDVQESISGYFDGVAAVNGQSFAVTDKDAIMIVGSESTKGITKIADVSGNAVISNVGGASEVVTDTVGKFTFAGHSVAFEVKGDSSVVFEMVDGAAASVAGINDFGLGISATVSGLLQGLTINGSSAAIVIEGDSDSVFEYKVDAKGNATLGGVGNEKGEVVTITETAGASFVQTNFAGTFKFAGGQSFTTDDDELTFKLNADGEVTEIYGLDKGNYVNGNFDPEVAVYGDSSLQPIKVEGDSSVTVYHGSLILKDISDLATIQRADGIIEAWTDSIAAGSSIQVTDGDDHTFVVAASASDANGVMFALEGTNPAHILGVSSLAQGATLGGDLGVLTSINGQSFGVTETAVKGLGGDGVFSVVGSEGGIGEIVGLGGSVAINDAGGAIAAVTDDDALITFADGGQFYAGGISDAKTEVGFIMNNGKAVAVGGISSNEIVMGSGSAFGNLIAVNTQKFDITGSSYIAVIGNEKSDGLTAIAVFGGSNVVVNEAASATDVLAAYVKQITFGSGSAFQIEGESSATFVSFEIDSALNVGAVSYVGAQESVTGDFTDVNTVNGQSFAVVDDEIMVVGNDDVKGISKIAKVSDGAVINNVGGASQVITDNVHKDDDDINEFFFVGHKEAFSVVGDSSVTFQMVKGAAASVAGITDFATNGESTALVAGNLNGLFINDKGTIDVDGDADDVLTYAKETYEGETYYGLAVAGSAVTVNGAASATFIEAGSDGKYTFAVDKDSDSTTYTVASAGDSAVFFEIDGNNVIGIYDFNKNTSVTGDFSDVVAVEGISANGDVLNEDTIQILGDSSVTVVYDEFEVRELSNGASITSATSFKHAYTDSATKALTVTDADGDQFTVENDKDGVHYLLDTHGNIIGVSGLDEGATLGGALGELKSINGKTFGIIEIPESDSLHAGDGKFSVVGGKSNTIGEVVGLSGFVIVTNAGGASILRADDNILLLNAMGSASQVFAAVAGEPKSSVLTASDGFNFYLNGDSVHAIDDIDGNEVVFTNNSFDGVDKLNDKDFKVVNDADEIAVLGKDGNDGIAAVIGVGNSVDGATVAAAAGASFVLADSEGAITFGSGSKADTFSLASDADSIGVGFYINDSVAVESIDYVNREETVFGKFSSGRIVNGDSIKATDDVDNVIGVRGSQSYAGVSELYVQANASVTAWGSATSVNAMNAGSFLFTGADNQNQTFYASDTNDSILTFITDKNKVTGVQNLDDGGIAFNPKQTNALDVNTADYPAQSLTFASTESLAAFNVADRYVIAAAGFNGSISGIIAPSATVYGVEGDTDINVNGKDIFVDDDDDQFNVVVHNAKPDYLYDVDGDATVIAESVSVRANSEGSVTNPTKDNFVIAGESYVFDDSKDENDGFTFVTDSNGSLNKVVSLEGALVINDGEWSGNINGDDFEVIDYPNDVNPPVTVNAGVSGIESVGGLDHKDTVNGDLGKAQVHIPGTDEPGGGDPATTITINGKPYTVVRDSDGVDVTGDNADVITDLDNQASLIGAEGEVTVNGTELEPEDGDVIKGDRDDNSHARIVGDDELIRQATAINHYNHQGYDLATDATTAAAFNIEDVVGLPTYTGAPFYYLDRESSDYAQIVAGTSLAVIDFDQPLVISLENVDGLTGEAYKTEQTFDMSEYSYTKKVYMNGEGPQGVKFNNEGGNLAIVAAGSTGVKNVSLGAGGDAVVMDEDYALQNAVNIYGGAGDDSVFVRHNANTYVDFSAGGEDILVTAGEANARVSIAGYQASTGAAIRVEEYLDVENETAGTIAEGIENGIISFAEGTVIITSDEGRSEVSVGTNGYGGQIVNLMTHATSGDDYKQAVGFTGVDGGIVDGSNFQSPLIMIGNSENTDTAGSSLIGGSANDTFYAGADDFISTGYGNDYVSLFNDSLRAGATVQIGDGRTTIDGMNNSLADSTGDVISVAIDPKDATFSLVYNASLGTVEIESAADGYYAVLNDVDTLEGNYTTQYIYDEIGTELYSVAIGTVNSTIQVTEDEDLRPNVFFGYQTAIDFRNYTGDAIIDLKGDMAESIIDETIVIIDDDITTLYAGAGDTALKGDLDDETLYAGKGNTWLYGDGGKNLLVGYNGNDKEGQTVFYVLGNEDGAAHTIAGFNYVDDDNFTDTKKVTADALEFDLDDNNISRIDISGNDLVIEITDKAGNDTESALLLDAINADGTGKDFIVSDNVAQVAENHLVFDQFADYYYATGKNATVEVSGRIEDDVVLWLDEDETGKVFEGDIAVIDATGSDATAQLAGNENDNAIFAGTGETSLWGGEGGNDVLVGNAGGRDTFYYSFGNGDDTITNVKDGDVIALDVSLDQIDEIDMSDASAIRIIMNDGDVLTINDAGHDVNVMIDNGEDGTDTYSTREARSRQ